MLGPAPKCDNCNWFEAKSDEIYCEMCLKSPVILQKLLEDARSALRASERELLIRDRQISALEDELEFLRTRSEVKPLKPVEQGPELPKVGDWQKLLEERARNLELE